MSANRSSLGSIFCSKGFTNSMEVGVLMGLNMPERSTCRGLGRHTAASSGYSWCPLATVPLDCIRHKTCQPSAMQLRIFFCSSSCLSPDFPPALTAFLSLLFSLSLIPRSDHHRSRVIDDMSAIDPLISNGTCYYGVGRKAASNIIPCGNAASGDQQCCQEGDYCLEYNVCFNANCK